MARPKGVPRHKPYVTKNGPYCGAQRRRQPGKKCKLIAGYKTDHPGQGRCYMHGGAAGNLNAKNLKHGWYSSLKNNTVKDRMDKIAEIEENVLNLVPEANLLRALTIDFIERYDDFVDALMKWYTTDDASSKPRRIMDITDASKLVESISRVVEKIHKMRQEGSISLETFRRVTEQMGISVAKHVTDRRALTLIEQDWNSLVIDAKRIDHHAAEAARENDEEWEDEE